MSALEARDAKHQEEKKLFLNLVDLLSYEKIIFNGRLISTQAQPTTTTCPLSILQILTRASS